MNWITPIFAQVAATTTATDATQDTLLKILIAVVGFFAVSLFSGLTFFIIAFIKSVNKMREDVDTGSKAIAESNNRMAQEFALLRLYLVENYVKMPEFKEKFAEIAKRLDDQWVDHEKDVSELKLLIGKKAMCQSPECPFRDAESQF